MYLAKPPALAAPAFAPSHEDWLNDLSSTFPRSVTRPTQNAPAVPQSASVVAACAGTMKPTVARASAAVTAEILLIKWSSLYRRGQLGQSTFKAFVGEQYPSLGHLPFTHRLSIVNLYYVLIKLNHQLEVEAIRLSV